MTDISNEIEFIYTLKDGVSAPAGQIKQSADTASQSVNTLNNEMAKTPDKARMATEEMNKLNVVAQLSALNGLKGALNGSIGSMTALGLVSEDVSDSLMKITHGFNLVVSAAQGMKSVRALLMAVNVQEGILATISTYTSALSNPAKLAIAGVALAGAGAVGGYLLGSQTTHNHTKNTTITVENTPENTQTGNQIYNIINGDAL